jgi:uncharacterized repeat protein (TIGR01451 family)
VLPEGVQFISATAGQGSCTNVSGLVVCELGTLASGARTQIAVVIQPTTLGPLTNRASVRSDDVEANPTNNGTVAAATVNTAADLALTLVASPNPAPVGGALVYELTVTNRGPAYAYEVWLTNTLPAGVTFVSAIAPDGFCTHNSGVVTCALGSLTAGSSTPVAITVLPGSVGRFTNSAVVRSAAIDAVPANDVASVAVDAALPPVVLTHPQNLSVTNGATATFMVAASGTAPLRYQWQFNGADMANATNSSLTLGNVTLAAVGSYRVRVTNLVGAVLSVSASLAVVVPPVISNLGDQATEEDTLTVAVAFTVSDPDGPASAITLSGAASEPGSGLPSPLVQANGFIFGESGGNRTLQVLPATNRFGTALITITARDADGQIATDTFVLTVLPVNDPPSLGDLFNRSMLEDAVLAIPIVVGDAESPAESLVVSASTDGPPASPLFPPGGITLSGTGTNRLLILQPAANQSGQASLTVTVTDTNGASASDSFVVSVAAVNDPPALNLPGNVVLDEDAGPQSIALTGLSSGASDEVQALVVSVTSSNVALIPQPVVRFTNGSSLAWIDFAPVTNGHGVSSLSVRVDDGGSSNSVTVRTFTVTVSPVNDLPVVSAIGDVVIDENSATAPLAFSVQDVESGGAALVVSAGSSDTNLVPVANLVLTGPVGGQGSAPADWTLVARPATNRFGVATMSVSVRDANGGTSVRSFELRVRQLPPVILAQPQGLTVTNGGMASFAVTASGSSLSYQWSFTPTGAGGCWPTGDIPGATNRIFTMTNTMACHAGSYRVAVSNGAGQGSSVHAVLRVLVSPTITGINRTGSEAQISFTSVSNLSYTVEFTDSLGAPAWGALPVAAGTGGVLSVTDPAATVPGRAYRVRVE